MTISVSEYIKRVVVRSERRVNDLPAMQERYAEMLAAPMPEKVRPPRPPEPRSIVGGLVANLHRVLQASDTKRIELEARIAADTEELRQTNVSISTVQAALFAMSDDPALSQEEKDKARAVVDGHLTQELETVDVD